MSLLSASLIIALTSLISRFLGLFRDRLLAGTFGAGDTLDMYYTSFRLPDLIFNLLILGALNSAFIPIFKDYLSKNKHKQAFRITNNLINFALISISILCVLILIFTPQFTSLIAPGFHGEKLTTTINLTRIMIFSPLFFSLSAITGGILNSFNRFISYSLAPIIYNLGIITGIIFLVPHFGIYGLAIGVIAGAAANFLIQIPETHLTGFRYQLILNLQDQGFKKILHLMLPTTISLAISQLNITVDTIIGSMLQSGSITVINFASNIQTLPIGILAIPICTTIFPSLVQYVSRRQPEKFCSQINKSAKQILFIMIPATVFLYIFRAQIVRLLLGTGAFNWDDTKLTLNALGFFALSLPFQSLLPLLIRGFYANQNTTKPLFSSFVALVSNIVFSLILSRYLGVAGLALSFSIASIINFFLLYYLLSQKISRQPFNFKSTLVKIIFSSVLSGFLSFSSLRVFEPLFDNNTIIGLFMQTSCSSIIGIGTYIGLSYILRIEEIKYLAIILSPLTKLFFSTKKKSN